MATAFVADQINATTADTTRLISAGATLTVTKALHAGKQILLDTLAGSVCTLPAALGTGDVYSFIVSALATSNSHKIQVANSTDIIQGIITTTSDDASGAGKGWIAGAADDTITLNRTTTGSVAKGERISLMDAASGVFLILDGRTASTGTEATPFSAAV